MHSTPTTWRDLAADLTPQQVAEMEYCEREQLPPGIYSHEGLVQVARFHIRHNRAAAACAHIPGPADAIDAPSPWELWDGDTCSRVFTAWEGREDGIVVQVLGMQYSDGRPTSRSIFFEDDADDRDMTAERARMLARLLIEASDVLGDGGEPPQQLCCSAIPCPHREDEPPFM